MQHVLIPSLQPMFICHLNLWCYCWIFYSFETSVILVSYRIKFHFVPVVVKTMNYSAKKLAIILAHWDVYRKQVTQIKVIFVSRISLTIQWGDAISIMGTLPKGAKNWAKCTIYYNLTLYKNICYIQLHYL